MSLKFVNISYQYEKELALSGINLEVQPGEVTCLLGASGCGKTTLLRLAAGLLDVQSGEILMDGDVLANGQYSPPPEKRSVGLVFQDGALFPHMTVADNVTFGMRSDQDKKILTENLLERVGLAGLGGRYPNSLSGGQKQRVALARAIAPEPDVLLLDEPFANVDIIQRRIIREDTRRVLKQRSAIAILVTHDPEEALEVADKIAVIERGRIVQFGTPEDLYNRPVSTYVGLLFGEGQLIPAEKKGCDFQTAFGSWAISHIHNSLDVTSITDGSYNLIIRAEDCVLVQSDHRQSALRIDDIRTIGAIKRANVRCAKGETMAVYMEMDQHFDIGDAVTIKLKNNKVHVFERD